MLILINLGMHIGGLGEGPRSAHLSYLVLDRMGVAFRIYPFN